MIKVERRLPMLDKTPDRFGFLKSKTVMVMDKNTKERRKGQYVCDAAGKSKWIDAETGESLLEDYFVVTHWQPI